MHPTALVDDAAAGAAAVAGGIQISGNCAEWL
jgi:hypothetical protein